VVPSTRIVGSIVAPDGTPFRGGSLNVSLSAPATALDPATSQRVKVFGRIAVPVADDGTVDFSLIPTSSLTPGSTYVAEFTLPDGRTWAENWTVPSSSSPLALGDVPRC